MSEEVLTELADDDRPVLRFVRTERDGQPMADRAEPLAPVEQVVPVVLGTLAGWQLASSDDDLTAALVAAGAVLLRHAHGYTMDGTVMRGVTTTRAPDGVVVGALQAAAPELAALAVAAYPPGHPDHQTVEPSVEEPGYTRLLSGEYLGPVMAASQEARQGGRLVGAAVLNDSAGQAPEGGPWVSDVMRLPGGQLQGLGECLLRRAITDLVAAGAPSLSLVVTDGNPARAVYHRLGFRPAVSARRLQLPPL